MKKPTLGQLNTILLVMYVICIPILVVFVRYALNYEKSWVNDHDQEIIEYDTKVIECAKRSRSSRPLYQYTVKLEFPDGKKMTYKSEHKEEGIKKVYEIIDNGKSYYGFSKVALYSQIHPFYSVSYRIIHQV